MGLLALFGNKNKPDKTSFDKFIALYPPSGNLTKPTQEMLEWYANKLPKALLDFWQEYGFGNYGGGEMKVVEPSDYMDSLYTWLGEEDHNKLPILMTGFGDIFYYRKLSDTEEDVCMLDIHHHDTDVCEYSLKAFFEDYVTEEKLSEFLVKRPLFKDAVARHGNIDFEEIFFFVPALALGGEEDAEHTGKGDAAVHHQLLFQLG